jgi:putative Holliday junction resolvase
MTQIISIDYGHKYSGIAISNNIDMIIIGLYTIDTQKLFFILKNYIKKYNIKILVIGEPKFLNNKHESIEFNILSLIHKIKTKFNFIIIQRIDERLTTKISKMIFYSLISKKKKRIKKKYIIHQISAMMILESYLFLNNYDLTYNCI